jgi:hypothetical protein
MLRLFLLANCATCAGFGALFVSLPIEVAAFLGTPPTLLISLIGAVLIVNALLLALTAWRFLDRRIFVAFFVLGDAGWVLLTLALLGLGIWIDGTAAILVAILVAGVVGALGYGQYYFGQRNRTLSRR